MTHWYSTIDDDDLPNEVPIPLGGISSNLSFTYAASEDAAFFSNLFSIPDYTSACEVSLYTQVTSHYSVDWSTMITTCLGVRIGKLEFLSDFEHVVEFPGLISPTRNNHDYTIHITTTLMLTGVKKLGNLIELVPSGGNFKALDLMFYEDSSSVQGTIYSSNITVFDTVIHTDVTIQGTDLTFLGEATIFTNYPVTVTGSFTSDNLWSDTPFLFECRLTSFVSQLNDYLWVFVEDIANEAALKREISRDSFDNSLSYLQAIEVKRNQVLQEYNEASEAYNQAVQEVNMRNKSLIQARQAYLDALSSYDQAEQLLDSCDIKPCDDVCVSGTECTTCYEESYLVEMGSCPVYTETQEIIVEEIPYATIGWHYVIRSYRCNGVNRNGYTCIPWFTTCYYTACVSYLMYKTHRRTIERTKITIENRPCQIQVYNESAPSECCEVYDCAYTVPDPACTEMNQECQTLLDNIKNSLGGLGDMVSQLYMDYLDAQTNLTASQLALTSKQVELDSAQQELNLVQPAYESALLNYEISQDNYQSVLAETATDYSFYELLLLYQYPQDLMEVVEISFSQTILDQTPFVFPVNIRYEVPYSGTTDTLQFVMNFVSPLELVYRQLSEALLGSIISDSLSTRRKRQQDVTQDLVYMTFQQKCTDIKNVYDYYQQLESLYYACIESFLNTSSTLGSISEIMLTTSNPTLASMYAELSNDRAALASQLISVVEGNLFTKWQANVELLHNSTGSIGGYECFGFVDCLQTTVKLMQDILMDTPGDAAKAVLSELDSLKTSVLKLGYLKNVSSNTSLETLSRMIQLVNLTLDLDYWCERPPNISMNPPLEVNITTGSILVLSCSAMSKLAVKYQWKKDNVFLNAGTNTLTIPNMELIDAGNYACQASNPIGSVDSLSTRVNVYYSPILNGTLADMETYEGDDDGINLACDAHSWPPPGWTWYFRSSTNDEWTIIANVDANILPLVDPRLEQEGWYKCKASNWMGNASSVAYVTILQVAIVRVMYPAEMTLNEVTSSSSLPNINLLSTDFVEAVKEALQLNITQVEDVSVSSNGSTHVFFFNLITPHMVFEDIVPMKIEDILVNNAFPAIEELEQAKTDLEDIVGSSHDGIQLESDSRMFESQPNTLQYSTRSFVCPDGYRIHENLIFCGKYIII